MTFLEAMEKIVPDCEATLRRFMGNEAMWKKFVFKFLDDPNYNALEEAVRNRDKGQIERTAHTIKGVAANLGFQPLSEACAQVVEDVRKDTMEKIDGDWAKLQEIYQFTAEGIKAYQREME